MRKRQIYLLYLLIPLAPSGVLAHQPVMDMAPRWSGGSGFQTRFEYVPKDNSQGESSKDQIYWFEGVYTFHPMFRATFKLPYERKTASVFKDGQIKNLEASGLGDMIVAFPLKYYRNFMTHTDNLAFNPSLTLPTGSTRGDLPLGRGTVDYGLSLSYAREAMRTFGLWDLWGKIHTEGFDGKTEGDIVGFDMNVGVYPYQNSAKEIAILLLSGTHVRYQFKERLAGGTLDDNTGGHWLDMGPILVILYKNLALRLEAYFPVYREMNGTQLVNDFSFQTGIGITFPSLKPF